MSEKEMLDQLKELIDDRNAFITADAEASEIFIKDKKALEQMISEYLKLKETMNKTVKIFKGMSEDTISGLNRYITYLQQKNKELSKMCELYSKSLYNAELTDYKARINKAIEYIDNFSWYSADDDETKFFVIEEEKEETFVKDLLEILGDKK